MAVVTKVKNAQFTNTIYAVYEDEDRQAQIRDAGRYTVADAVKKSAEKPVKSKPKAKTVDSFLMEIAKASMPVVKKDRSPTAKMSEDERAAYNFGFSLARDGVVNYKGLTIPAWTKKMTPEERAKLYALKDSHPEQFAEGWHDFKRKECRKQIQADKARAQVQAENQRKSETTKSVNQFRRANHIARQEAIAAAKRAEEEAIKAEAEAERKAEEEARAEEQVRLMVKAMNIAYNRF